MLAFFWLDTSLFIFLWVYSIVLWFLYYFSVNVLSSISKALTTDKLKKNRVFIKVFLTRLLLPLFLVWCFLYNYITARPQEANEICWQNININNHTQFYFSTLVFVLIVCWFVSMGLQKQNITINSEYIILIYFFPLFGQIMFSSSNLFLLIFTIELIGLLIFNQFVLNNGSKKNNRATKDNPNVIFVKKQSYGLFNAAFFQFWANFVSSVLLIFSLINFHHIFGVTKFFFLNFFVKLCEVTKYIPISSSNTIFLVLSAALFVKTGIAPYQFFKVETYKGIPLYVLVVYTILYLIIYIYTFIYMYQVNLVCLKESVSLYLLLSASLGVVYLFSLLFDTTNFKAFLSYSTLINLINLLIVIFSN